MLAIVVAFFAMALVWIKALWHRLWFSLWLWIRPALKWGLRRSTQLCELLRICYGTLPGAERSVQIEFSLEHSCHPELRKCCHYLDEKAAQQQLRPDVSHYAVYTIVRVKEVSIKIHPSFSGQLLSSIGSIWGYRQLLAEVEAMRAIKCLNKEPPSKPPPPPVGSEADDAQGPEPVADKLGQLWEALMPDTPLTGLVTKQWQDVGFQGDDPCTDFRGMGLLGLENLLYFALSHTSAARHVLSRSWHPQYGYSFAIVGINLTALAHSLLRDGAFKHHFYNTTVKEVKEKVTSPTGGVAGLILPSMRQFHQIYCHLFINFDALWRSEKPRDIMEFSRIRDQFEAKVRADLLPYSTVYKSSFVLNDV